MQVPDYLSELGINQFEKVDFYQEERFMSIHEVVTTHEEHNQKLFNVIAYHRYDDESLDIEMNVLMAILVKLGKENVRDLMKISSCTFWTNKYKEREEKKILDFLKRAGGKWYFFPDQRTEVENLFIDNLPEVSCEVKDFSEYNLPETSHLNRFAVEVVGSMTPVQFRSQKREEEN